MANITGNRKIISLLHCNMFSCLETSPIVLRTGCLPFSISFLQYKTYRLTYLSLGLGCPSLTHREVSLGPNSQVLQKFVPHIVDYNAEAGYEQILSRMSPVMTNAL